MQVLPSKESLAGLEHLVDEEGGAVAGGLGAHQRAAPGEALAGEHARPRTVGDPLVLAEHVADLAAAHADVAGRDVGVLADVAVQLGHEALAEAHDLVVRLALGVEVGAALAAADGQAGQGVLEDLLEAEELDDAEVDRGVEAQAALVGPERGVELDAEAAVDLDLALVVLPRHPEDDLPFRLADALDDLALAELGVLGEHRSEATRAPRARPGGTPPRPGCASGPPGTRPPAARPSSSTCGFLGRGGWRGAAGKQSPCRFDTATCHRTDCRTPGSTRTPHG